MQQEGNKDESEEASLQAYVKLMTEHQTNLRAFIVSLMPGSQDVGDVVQNTNAVLWEKRKRFEPGTNFLAWAFKIARYEVMCQRNRSKRDQRLVFSEKLIDVITEKDPFKESDEEVLNALENCIAKLTEHERDLVKARYTPGESLERLAAETERSPGSLRVALYRIRAGLKNCIETSLGSNPA